MRQDEPHPDERRLLALLDGELGPDEAHEVRQHCEACERCRERRDELAAVGETLRSLPEADPIRPIWPAVRELRSRPVLRPVFGAAAAAAVAAGILLGVQIGSAGGQPVETGATSVWSVAGSSFADDGVSSAWARMASGEER